MNIQAFVTVHTGGQMVLGIEQIFSVNGELPDEAIQQCVERWAYHNTSEYEGTRDIWWEKVDDENRN